MIERGALNIARLGKSEDLLASYSTPNPGGSITRSRYDPVSNGIEGRFADKRLVSCKGGDQRAIRAVPNSRRLI
jgi:hypothetical protein